MSADTERQGEYEEMKRALYLSLIVILGEYPSTDETHVTALAHAKHFFPDEDWSDYEKL